MLSAGIWELIIQEASILQIHGWYVRNSNFSNLTNWHRPGSSLYAGLKWQHSFILGWIAWSGWNESWEGLLVVNDVNVSNIRAVFKWLSKVITWLRLPRLVIGLKDSRQYFNQWEAKPKSISPCTRHFSRDSGELQVIGRNYDWFIELSVPGVIGRSNCFGFGFSTVIWKPLYHQQSPVSILLSPGPSNSI